MRRAIAILAVTVAACAGQGPGPTPERAEPSPLQGRWKAVESKVYREDGTTFAQSGIQCVSEFTGDRAVSDCTLPDGRRSHIVMAIESMTPTSYETKVLENAAAPYTVGMKSRVEYRLIGGKMMTTAYPPRESARPPHAPVLKIESVYVREQ